MTREDERDMACTNWICSQENGTVIMAREVWKAAVKWADSHPHWISIEEELPPIPEKWYCVEVLFRTKDSANHLGKYFGDKWISYEDYTFRTEDISHWMEIVPPRKEE